MIYIRNLLIVIILLGGIYCSQDVTNSNDKLEFRIEGKVTDTSGNPIKDVGVGFIYSIGPDKSISVSKNSAIGASDIPEEFDMNQNYPNPFGPETTIRYQLPVRSNLSLNIYNIHDTLVNTTINEVKKVGFYTVKWNGKDEAQQPVMNGLYRAKIEATKNDSTLFQKTIDLFKNDTASQATTDALGNFFLTIDASPIGMSVNSTNEIGSDILSVLGVTDMVQITGNKEGYQVSSKFVQIIPGKVLQLNLILTKE